MVYAKKYNVRISVSVVSLKTYPPSMEPDRRVLEDHVPFKRDL